MTTESSINTLVNDVADIDGDIDALILVVAELRRDVRKLENYSLYQANRITELELGMQIERGEMK